MTVSIGEVVAEVRTILEGDGVSDGESHDLQREAEWIVEAATGAQRSEILAGRAVVEDDVAGEARDLAQRRLAGEPLQYLTGLAGFRRLEIEVGPGVFIPRPETELVVERALERLPRGGTLFDVGTGSGAAALAVKDERPDVVVVAGDVASDAVGWAQRNRDRLELDVEIVQSDVFDGFPAEMRGQVDVIVSNPPYIPEGFVLPAVVQDYEPREALFADGHGLAVIERLVLGGLEWLRPGGWLVMEMDQSQRTAVAGLLEASGYAAVDIVEDMAGRPRIAEARRP